MELEKNLETVEKLGDTLIQFAVTYGFQIIGALVFLLIGLKIAGWLSRKVSGIAEAKDIDITLSKFIGSFVRILVIGVLIIITLGNFGISIAPLIAVAGAGAFGATMALQGPLSNYGAGLSIILGRPFTVGDTITIGRTSGVVQDVKLAGTVLVGEDGERITVPNKEIVGKVIVNSEAKRVVQTKIAVPANTDLAGATRVIREVLSKEGELDAEPAAQVGVHDFTYGGIVLGARYWVPSQRYFEVRYRVNAAILEALNSAGIPLLSTPNVALVAGNLSSDEADEEDNA